MCACKCALASFYTIFYIFINIKTTHLTPPFPSPPALPRPPALFRKATRRPTALGVELVDDLPISPSQSQHIDGAQERAASRLSEAEEVLLNVSPRRLPANPLAPPPSAVHTAMAASPRGQRKESSVSAHEYASVYDSASMVIAAPFSQISNNANCTSNYTATEYAQVSDHGCASSSTGVGGDGANRVRLSTSSGDYSRLLSSSAVEAVAGPQLSIANTSLNRNGKEKGNGKGPGPLHISPMEREWNGLPHGTSDVSTSASLQATASAPFAAAPPPIATLTASRFKGSGNAGNSGESVYSVLSPRRGGDGNGGGRAPSSVHVVVEETLLVGHGGFNSGSALQKEQKKSTFASDVSVQSGGGSDDAYEVPVLLNTTSSSNAGKHADATTAHTNLPRSGGGISTTGGISIHGPAARKWLFNPDRWSVESDAAPPGFEQASKRIGTHSDKHTFRTHTQYPTRFLGGVSSCTPSLSFGPRVSPAAQN